MEKPHSRQKEQLIARREKQRVEGAIAMREYLAAEEATRLKTKRLRAQRLEREEADGQSAD
jgi:hypothetical protein